MKYLIDTHVLLWAIMESYKLPEKILKLLENDSNTIFVSPISYWEIAIKHQNKKLNLGKINVLHIPHIAEQFNFSILNPEPYDYINLGQIPQKENHHDPFDRMLIAQAKAENMSFLTHDSLIPCYNEKCIISV